MELSDTVELVVDVEVVDELWIDAQHAFGEVGVHPRGFEQADVQRRLTNATSVSESPAHRLA